jgi:hypothetical protein
MRTIAIRAATPDIALAATRTVFGPTTTAGMARGTSARACERKEARL